MLNVIFISLFLGEMNYSVGIQWNLIVLNFCVVELGFSFFSDYGSYMFDVGVWFSFFGLDFMSVGFLG